MTSVEIIQASSWLKPQKVSTMLSPWIWTLLPDQTKLYQEDLFKAAAILGIDQADKVLIGQVSHDPFATMARFTVRTPRLASSLAKFGRVCCMTSHASILRTAIMLGLGLPKVELGVMSQTRREPLTSTECSRIVDLAHIKYPGEFNVNTNTHYS